MARTFRSRHAGSGTVACFLFLCLFFCVTGSPHSAIQTELFEGVQPSSAKVDVRVYVTAKSSTCRELLTQVVAHVVQKDEVGSLSFSLFPSSSSTPAIFTPSLKHCRPPFPRLTFPVFCCRCGQL
eukprot:47850-Rhodomonas_salina.1